MKDALVRGAVTEKADGDATGVAQLRIKRDAGGEGDAAAGDAVRAEKADGRIHHHLAAASAARVPRFASEEFGHNAFGIGTARQKVAVSTVRGGHGVTRLERRSRADSHGFLPDAGVCGAHDASFKEQTLDRLFKEADHAHQRISLNGIHEVPLPR